ncbi:uncharacterized protein F4817DRAFT_322005 [Daldinia loculata]|uniref:uncharacterized protein n=1 Tax=Daldinia loculata TaxID=103429 RepID=UPI0020C36553|nr:uncharacterized protein F4817DRAFT_322005 [Daldinia loculata]KAI1652082.1 hypothetical protein F4817DRAFT_322005 [Daldinia loculata]
MVTANNNTESNNYGWRECWGVKINWTPEHLTADDLKPLIRTYDTISTEALAKLNEIWPLSCKTKPSQNADSAPGKKKARRDLYELLQEHAFTDDKIGRLWNEINTIPDWVDWEQIERGQKVFYRYGGAVITTLTFLSLLGGMGSGRTVETLDRTGGFGVDAVRRRLLETTQHILNVTHNLESIKPGGDGFADSVRVRLLHAAVRRRIMHMAEKEPRYYDMKTYGVPINDLDCIGTINTFSATMIWMGLPRQGIWLRKQEIADYLALWRYVAYLMGAPHDWMSTPESARRMMESLLVAEIKPSKASANLANNIISGLQDQPPTYAPREFLCAQTYWLNGRELSKELGIEEPSLYYTALVVGQCILFATLSYVNRSISYLDERNIKLVRMALYKVLLQNKSKGALGYTTKFNFKYMPSFNRTTTVRGPAPAQEGRLRAPGRVERAALFSLLASAVVVYIVSSWCYAKVVRWLDTY